MDDIPANIFLGYIFGIAACAFAIFVSFVSLLSGVFLMAAGLFATPAIRDSLRGKTGYRFSQAGVVIIVVSLSVTSFGALQTSLDAGNNTDSGTDGQVADVDFAAENVTFNNTQYSLAVTWNAQAQTTVDPNEDDSRLYEAEDGTKYIVTRMQIENTGDGEIDLRPNLFRVLADGVEYSYQGLIGSNQGGLSQVTVRAGATYEGWLAFSVPDSTSSAELIVNQETYRDGNVTVEWRRNSSMDVGVGG